MKKLITLVTDLRMPVTLAGWDQFDNRTWADMIDDTVTQYVRKRNGLILPARYDTAKEE